MRSLDGGRDGDRDPWVLWRRAAAKKGRQLLERLVLHRTVSLRQLGEDEAGERAFRRFVHNRRVSEGELIGSARSAVLGQVAGRRILAIQDTSELNFSTQPRRKRALGRGGSRLDPGLFMHPLLVIDGDLGAVIGLADVQLWDRNDAVPNEPMRPIEEKESCRWLRGAEAAASLRDAGASSVTVIADREGDIYAAFARRPTGVELLVRAQTDRGLADGGLLFRHLDGLPVADRYELDLPAVPGRAPRTATLELRYAAVVLKRPGRTADRDLPKQIEVFVVDVREADAPSGSAPIHWRLLSSAPVADLADAHQRIADYRQRWHIEQLFRTVKGQGLGLEDSQIEPPCALRKLALIALRAAVTCMQLVHARDGRDQRPATAAFNADDLAVLDAIAPTVDGRTKRLSNPHPPHSLAWAAWVIARLGGWTGASTDRPPGPITMHRGLQRFDAIAHGFSLANVSGR